MNTTNRVVFATILGFLVGVAINSVLNIHHVGILVISVLLTFFAVLCFVFKKIRSFSWIFFLIAAFLWGIFHVGNVLSNDLENSQKLTGFIDEQIVIEGVVIRDPDRRLSSKKVVVDIDRVQGGFYEESQIKDVHILVTLDRHADIQYGDLVHIRGRLSVPGNFITDTGREFDYKNYLAKDDVFYQMYLPEFEVLDTGYGSRITAWMLSLKHVLLRSINRAFSEPQGSLLAGELFGEKSALGGELQDAFRRTGVIHIVVLSGFNITIVSLFIIWLLTRFLHPRVALFFGIAGIVLFALLVGGGATVIRASIMAILVIIARLIGRDYDVTRGLFLAAFFMILHNPKILVFDISFQLSFLATLSLIYIAPHIEKKLGWVTTKIELRETLVQTLSAQVFVMPLLLYSIGEFSIVSVIVNVLVVPLVPMTMLFGFITGAVGLVSQTFAIVFMFPAYLLLNLQLIFVELFNKLSFASVHIPPIPWWLVLGLYFSIGIWVAKQYKKNLESGSIDSSSKFAQ